jgi:Leucine-rich repeat (LRR) protein
MDLSFSEIEEEGVLTEEQAKLGLGHFARSHDNMFANVSISLVDKFLTDIDVIRSPIFAKLQIVDVSGNALRNLEALMALPELRVILASDNQLDSTDSIPRHKFLDTIDLSRNFLVNIGDWSSCPFLRHLSLRSNAIREISGFEAGPLLETLDVADNQITDLTALSAFKCLEKLDISDNQITDLSGVDWDSFSLSSLNISGNQIRSLRPFQNSLVSLVNLDASRNLIVLMGDCSDNLKHMDLLAFLNLAENPVVSMPHYRLRVVYGLQRLSMLDGILVTADEVAQAKNAHGVFLGQREKMWKSVHESLPFVDQRILTEMHVANEF